MWVQMGAMEMFGTFMPVLFMTGVWKCHLDTWFCTRIILTLMLKGLSFRGSNNRDIFQPRSTKSKYRGYRLAKILTLYPRNFVFVDLGSQLIYTLNPRYRGIVFRGYSICRALFCTKSTILLPKNFQKKFTLLSW